MTDVNHQEYSKAAIQCTRFHSNAAVVLTAGLDKSLRLFQVDGKENTKIQSVFFKDMPIMSADFRYVQKRPSYSPCFFLYIRLAVDTAILHGWSRRHILFCATIAQHRRLAHIPVWTAAVLLCVRYAKGRG